MEEKKVEICNSYEFAVELLLLALIAEEPLATLAATSVLPENYS